jgi:hypothetical protein
MNDLYPAGRPAPNINLEAVESGRTVNPGQPDARYLVLVFQSQKTARAMAPIQDRVRRKFLNPADVRIASVVDLSGVPRMFKGMAKSALKQAYQDAASHLPEEWKAVADPADYIIILPDWKGDFFKAFGVGDANEQAVAVVIDRQGTVLGSQRGGKLSDFVVSLLDDES